MTDIHPQADKLFSEKWIIPGMGEASPSCGNQNWITLRCSTGKAGHDHQKIVHSCKRLNCPICHDEGAWREAFKASERLDGISQQWRQYNRDLRHPVHIVTSPGPDDMYRPIEDLRKISRKIRREIGAVGGLDVFHPYRGSSKIMQEIRERKRTGRPSPHFHSLDFMPARSDDRLFDADQIESIHRRTGWVIKILPREIRKGDRAGQYFNVVNKIHYELDHCGIELEHQNKHTLRWWGIAAYNNIHTEIEKIVEEHTCSVCGAPVHTYRISEEVITPARARFSIELGEMISREAEVIYHEVDEGPHIIRRTERHYQLRPDQANRLKIKWGDLLGPEIGQIDLAYTLQNS